MALDVDGGRALAGQFRDGRDFLGAEGAADAGGAEAGGRAEGFQCVRARLVEDPAVGQEQPDLLVGIPLDLDEVFESDQERVVLRAVLLCRRGDRARGRLRCRPGRARRPQRYDVDPEQAHLHPS
ncbi:hypothetical protein [Streptomyces sp. NPDC005167]